MRDYISEIVLKEYLYDKISLFFGALVYDVIRFVVKQHGNSVGGEVVSYDDAVLFGLRLGIERRHETTLAATGNIDTVKVGIILEI